MLWYDHKKDRRMASGKCSRENLCDMVADHREMAEDHLKVSSRLSV